MSRLSFATATSGLALPDDGHVLAIGARAATDLSDLSPDRWQVVQRHYPDVMALREAGFDTVLAPDKMPFAAAYVLLPRAKAEARAAVAQAVAAAPDGLIIVDGAKTDGIDGLLRDIRKRVALLGQVSKAHGKLAWFQSAPGFDDWASPGPARNADDWITAPGVFSADGVDPGSALLAQALPAGLKGHVVDLGAGWGYLSAQIAARAPVTRIDLVEADALALDCARMNVTDPRAAFHWADATRWRPEGRADVVVANPPFHSSRDADPGLGQAFLRQSAAILAPSGQLFLVANRHLPYETTLRSLFRDIEEVSGTKSYKILRAARPLKAPR